MNRPVLLTAAIVTGVGLVVVLPQWRLNADEPSLRQREDDRRDFRGRGRPGMEPGGPGAMRDQVLRRFDEILDRLARIEQRLGRGPGDRQAAPGPRSARPPRPEWMDERGDRFGPGEDGPWGSRSEEGRMGSDERPLDRLQLPDEMRRRMEERMQRGEQMRERARERMEQAREKFAEMQERIEALEAEVEQLRKAQSPGSDG